MKHTTIKHSHLHDIVNVKTNVIYNVHVHVHVHVHVCIYTVYINVHVHNSPHIRVSWVEVVGCRSHLRSALEPGQGWGQVEE